MRAARTLTGVLLAAVTAISLTACQDPIDVDSANAEAFDLSAAQEDRPRAEVNPELAAQVPEEIGADGTLTLGTLVTPTPPLIFFAVDDNSTPIGAEVDLAQLVADKLGLELDVQLTSWDNWPLKLDAGDYDIVHANIGITEERLEKYDFSTNRGAVMAFQKDASTPLEVDSAEDLAGLTVAVTAGTNQEKILLEFSDQLVEQGLEPIEPAYYVNENDSLMAMLSGHIDLMFGPNPSASWREAQMEDIETAWEVNAGWPDETLVATTMRRGTGLAPLITQAYDEVGAEGLYDEVIDRWELQGEALETSETHSLEEYSDVEY